MVKYLLRESGISPGAYALPGIGVEVSEEEKENMREGKKELLEFLPKGLEGADFVKEVYRIYDELTVEHLKNYDLACGQKCDHCCYQLVAASQIEMKLIEKYIKSLLKPRLKKIRDLARKRSKEFNVFFKALYKEDKFMQEDWKDLLNRINILWEGRPCPYLMKDKNCGIYPVRSIDCRMSRVRVRCNSVGLKDKDDLKPVRFVIDQVTSDILMDENTRLTGQTQVVPLIYWPLTKGFQKTFKL